MSQFISLRILASIGMGRFKNHGGRGAPHAPSVAERTREPRSFALPAALSAAPSAEGEEPKSASRISVGRIAVLP
jgi:hypothetical protein